MFHIHSYTINKLINIKNVIVKNISHADYSIKIYLDTRPKLHICPCCGKETKRIHDYREQTIKDLPLQFKNCYLVLRKRRYICSCGKKFYEHYDFLARYQQRTTRLTKYIVSELRNTVSIHSVSKRCNVSTNTVSRILDTINYTCPTLKEAISIDEFRGNTNAGKFQCILVNPIKSQVLDILPNRSQSCLTEYFKNISKSERYRIKYFVCDMWQPFVDIARAYFPNAKIIIDKYHFIRQVTWAIENVRKRLQKTMLPSLRKYYKRSRKLILSRYNELHEDNKTSCDLMLQYNDDLRRAHSLKEWFHEICNQTKYSIQRKEFFEWIHNAENSGLPEFEKCATTYRHWSEEILNAFKYGITNGTTEGCNNKIKVLKRVSYGVTNFDRFRTRILHSFN